ncbi:MAG: GYD domain-containing protein [Mycobacteriales bacterium]
MAQYMIFARYAPEVLKSLLDDPDGLAARDEHAWQFYGSVGGKVLHWWFIRDAEYHFAVVVDFPDAEAAHAAIMVGYASGAFTEGKLLALATQEEAVSALRRAWSAGRVFYPPGAEGPQHD